MVEKVVSYKWSKEDIKQGQELVMKGHSLHIVTLPMDQFAVVDVHWYAVYVGTSEALALLLSRENAGPRELWRNNE